MKTENLERNCACPTSGGFSATLCLIDEMNKFYFLISLFCLFSCTNSNVEYIRHEDGKAHTIDIGIFQITTPANFRYQEEQGIDSFVGKFTDGKNQFLFDYGMYSPRPPQTRADYYSELKETLPMEVDIRLFEIADISKVKRQEDGSYLLRDLDRLKQGFKVFGLDDVKKDSLLFLISYDSQEYRIPFKIPEDKINEFENYIIEIDTIDCCLRTLSLWKDSLTPKSSSVNLALKDSLSRRNTLWVGYIPQKDSNLTFDEIEKVLRSVKLKN